MTEASDIVTRAAEVLRAGGLVAVPTETVYGLAADATNEAAVAKIFAAKGRPPDHPLIAHIADADWLTQWADSPPELARRLGREFWPGPLTIIVGRGPGIPKAVTGGRDTVALRVPGHPLTRAIIEALG
ncbi:MAG: threonylcarbamoyl-AMP synthase, partial [Deltaproteobacteria bacterium]|nr:threonylcarbamoyl-AMP synthase [Deltaproteobacteria bacterium]